MSSLWLDEAPPFVGADLPGTADVVVVGAGIAGIVTALHLARRGIDVVVLDAGEVAGRASGRNDGQLLLGLGEHYNRIHGQFGAARARELWAFLQRNHDALLEELTNGGVACDLEVQGGLRLAETPHEWRELVDAAALLASEGRPHALVPAADLPRWLPDAVGFHGALHLVGEAIVQPAAMVRGLAGLATRDGARVVPHAAVQRIEGEAGEFVVQLRDGRRLTAPAVVHCTSALARELDETGLLSRAVFPFRGQILASDALPAELAARFPAHAMSSNFCYEYFRMHRGRFVIGGKRWAVPGEELGVLDDETHNEAISAHLRDYVHLHFPSLRGVPLARVWTGIMAGTPDGLPLCGAMPGRAGVFALLGFNGYGLSFAYHAGRCLADLIVDGQSPEPALSMFAPRRLVETR